MNYKMRMRRIGKNRLHGKQEGNAMLLVRKIIASCFKRNPPKHLARWFNDQGRSQKFVTGGGGGDSSVVKVV